MPRPHRPGRLRRILTVGLLLLIVAAIVAWRTGHLVIKVDLAIDGQDDVRHDDVEPVSDLPVPRDTPRLWPDRSVRVPEPGSPGIVPVGAEEPADPDVADLETIDRLIRTGETIAVHRELSRIYFAEPARRRSIQKRIEVTAGQLYFSPRPHLLPAYIVRPGDRLSRIAPRYHIGWQYLARLNRISPKKIRAGQKLKVVRGPLSVQISLADFSLIVRAGELYVRRYRIGIGRDNSTPVGRFKVLSKIPDPQYTDPDGRVFEARDPLNPLGRHWLDLGDSYGIHGTNDPASIGRAASRGCIRLSNSDVEEIAGMLVVGSPVVIRR